MARYILFISFLLFADLDEKELAKIQNSIGLYFFYSHECEHCSFVKDRILPPLIKKYNLKIKFFEIGDPSNYEYLVSIEEKYGDKNNEIPVVVIGKYILGGLEEIEKSLEEKIIEYKDSGCGFPDIRKEGSVSCGKIEAVYFYDSKCKVCARINYEIPFLQKLYPNLNIKEYETSDRESQKLNEAFCEFYKVPSSKRLTVPMLFIGNDYFTQEDLKKMSLKEILEKYKGKETTLPWEEVLKLKDKAEENIQKRFKNIGIFTIILAGLIDGINPCAFATIIFLIAFLSTLGKKAEETLLAGITYSSMVFIVYFLIGVGLIKFITLLKLTNVIGKIILSCVALLAIFFGVLSFYDYIKLKKGEISEVKLQLPRGVKKRIHFVIREKMGKRNIFIASVISGFFVSLSEFICTGQIYLPTIAFVTGIPQLRVRALIYLIFYNVAFIVPLVVVFLSVYRGMKSEALNKFWSKKVKFVKLATSFFFVFLGIFVILYISLF
ncbi:MAG: hypothetical protein ABIN61_05645 [candidate division WOR-3 bacterium]